MRLEGSEARMLSWWRPVSLAPREHSLHHGAGPASQWRGWSLPLCASHRLLWGVGPGLASWGGKLPFTEGESAVSSPPSLPPEAVPAPRTESRGTRAVYQRDTWESLSLGERDLSLLMRPSRVGMIITPAS